MIPDALYKTIDELCVLTNGNGFNPSNWSDVGLPIIRIQNLNGSREFNYYAGEPKEKWIIEPGDLLFAWAGVKGVSFGPTIWSGPRGVLNQHIYKVIPIEGVDKIWLYSALSVITSQIEAKAHGFKSSLVHVHKSDITKQLVYFPRINAQRKIAEIVSTWDKAIALLEQLITAKRKLKQGLMQQLLTGKKRFKEFEDSEWQENRLSDIADVIDPHPSHRAPKECLEGIPFVGIGDISENGEIDISKVRKVHPSIADEHAKTYIIKEGDLAFGRVASIGKVVKLKITSFRYTISPTMSLIKPNNNIVSSFLPYALQSPIVIRQISALTNGSTRQSLGIMNLREIMILIPSLSEQQKIASILSAADTEISNLEKQLAAYKQQKRGLMQQLLTGKKRVKIDEPQMQKV